MATWWLATHPLLNVVPYLLKSRKVKLRHVNGESACRTSSRKSA